MEQNLQIGPPTPGSDREKMFKGYSQQLRDVVKEAVRKRRSGEEQESIPFIDSLLQSGVPDEQVCYILIIKIMHIYFFFVLIYGSVVY